MLVGPGTFDSLKRWIHGSATCANHTMPTELHRVYPSIPANMRRPIKVLSLFDGIGTELGFKVDKYVASEICSELIAVSKINHEVKIILMSGTREDGRPFRLFDNVVFMNNKANIFRFLVCNPVLVDAVKVSPAHKAQYFWGSIPGMNRPIITSQNDKVNLQDFLERGRVAKFTKVRTIPTNSNSLKQNKDVGKLPVSEKGVDDMWITVLEKEAF
ncbi:DNA (cytosine-5)-methyltransferase 3C-like [Salmo trutta]|uniref:DNA (cytosine-5)-methyltransferase 3C-like n=1 Tax=Salmo trutta TaxID=8032 RepID=UPI0011308A63|nr:DNA (cytosine-5)-methyltransferase 3C-like [Salmo trutta]